MSQHATYQKLRGQLAYLKLATAAERLPTLLETANADKLTHTQFLHELLEAEVSATEQRRLDSRLRMAGLPSPASLESFDFDAQPALDRRLVDELATLRFIEQKANALLIGPPGGRQDAHRDRVGAQGRRGGLSRLLHDRGRPGRQDQQGRAGGPLADDDALLERPAASGHR